MWGLFSARERFLKNISLQIQGGELVGIIGANGSGKTTLLKSLAWLLKPRNGQIKLMNHPLVSLSPARQAQFRGYLPQSGDCHWPISVERVVELGRLPFIEPWKNPTTVDRLAIEEAISQCELEGIRHRAVDTLSGGERSRVLAARALAGKPQILLADEPLVGLDPYHQLQLMELFRQVATDPQRAAVVIMHDLSLAGRFCHRLILLHEGEILADGTPDQVLSEANISRAYRITVRHLSGNGQNAVVPWDCIGR